MNGVGSLTASTRRVPLRHRLPATLVLAPLSRWRGGQLLVSLPDGSEHRFGDAGRRPVRLMVKSWKFFRRVLTAGDVGVGESYMAGEWSSDDLAELCRQFLHEQSVLRYRSPWTLASRLHHAVLRLLHANRPARSARNIQYHYDLSNDLYQLFLDDSLTYSCAVFEPADLSLGEAQIRKIDQICHRLELHPGLAVLEIGSGWGAFAIHAARHYGCRVTSLTLSRQQLELARERVAAAGLESAVDIRLCDYRAISGSFDRIVSIEMFEAVGYEYYRAFFEQCHRLLQPGGRMFLQTITVPDQRFERYRREFDWIRKYIFPGGLLASAHAIATALMRYTDLRIEWMQDIGPHYARTLRCWRERFLSHAADLHRLGFDERFRRMWEFYLASCEAAFATRHIGDVQMVLRRPAIGVGTAS